MDILVAMYEFTLILHSFLRWIALLLPAFILVRSTMNWLKKSGPADLDTRLIRSNIIVYDVQFVIGLLLYVVLSPVTAASFAEIGIAMRTKEMRFFLVEHIAIMIVAVALAHLLKVVPAKKEGAQRSLFQMIFSLLLIIVVLIGIPWFRPLFRL